MIVKNNQLRFFFLIEIKEQKNLLRRKNNKQKLISVLIVKFTFYL